MLFIGFAAIVVTALIYLHFRWALIDPHNVSAINSPFYLAVMSMIVSFLFGLSQGLHVEGKDYAASLIFAFSFGAFVGPAIFSPYKLSNDEEPSWLKRFIEEKKMSAGGAVIKTAMIFIISPIVGWFNIKNPEFWTVSLLAVYLNFSKCGVLIAINGNIENKNYISECLFGVFSTIAILYIVFPFYRDIAPPQIEDYFLALAFVIGILTTF